uniref:Uncharacterized protein LOC111127426 n=1 Tax=Crassostrea virginica TaxID=6565 RepID=A0A8B8DMV1_CRAVI|nr:uncharacterized protein LOC111127426 [Crassostrea virginica]
MNVILMVVFHVLSSSDLTWGFLVDGFHWCVNDVDCVAFYNSDSCHCADRVTVCVCKDHHLYDTTTTSSASNPTTNQHIVPLECSNHKISVIESIAENLHVEDDRAGLCPGTNKHQTSEALVINKCNATARTSWLQGPKSVPLECSKNTIQAYTPISTFFDSFTNVAGFFIDCTVNDDGITLKIWLWAFWTQSSGV